MSEKFTPGPWEAYNSVVHTTKKDSLPPDRTWGYGLNDGFICCLDDGEYHNYSDPEECAANAHLIAAAPEMYEMLDFLLDFVMNGGNEGEIRECYAVAIEYVLKKARGEA